MSDHIGLYYPFIDLKDDAWVKLAALYWDKLGRIVPVGYTPRNSSTVQELSDELEFIKDFGISDEDKDFVGEVFSGFLIQHLEQLRNLYSIEPATKFTDAPVTIVLGDDRWHGMSQGYYPVSMNPRDYKELDSKVAHIIYERNLPLTYFAEEKFGRLFGDDLVSAGLAIYLKTGEINLVGMHPKLALIYMEVLAERMASRLQFHPVTDNILDHVAISGFSIERLTQALIPTVKLHPSLSDASITNQEIEVQMATISLQSIFPRDIASIPTKKIIRFRTKHRDELTAFQTYIHDLVAGLEMLKTIDDPTALKAHLEVEYEKNLKPQLDDLKKCMQSLGFDAAMGALNIRVAIPPLLASSTPFLHLALINPIVAGVGAIAFSLFPVIQKKQKDAKQAIHSSPAAYLFYAKEGLQPANLTSQITQHVRHMFFQV
jgi:hypothetical protein